MPSHSGLKIFPPEISLGIVLFNLSGIRFFTAETIRYYYVQFAPIWRQFGYVVVFKISGLKLRMKNLASSSFTRMLQEYLYRVSNGSTKENLGYFFFNLAYCTTFFGDSSNVI